MKMWFRSRCRYCSDATGRVGGWLILLAIFLSVAGCGHHKRPPPSISTLAPVVKPAAPSADDYRILPADVLNITVFQETDLKSTLRVSSEGTIGFPLIGAVAVGGLTPQEAAQQIQTRLARGYYIDPQVTVTVLEFSKRRFTVLGQVQKPGAYDMPDQQEVTLLQAIGMAGGYTRIANSGKVTLMRRIDGRERVFPFNARKMADGSAESAFLILPGDVITVAESRF